MPTKMATSCKEKAVFVTLYVERPRKKRIPQSQHHHHHHHHHHLHQTIKREVIVHNRGASSNAYDRRAQLLQYSQHLRASALSPSPSPLNSSSSGNKKPESQVVDVLRKSKRPGTPATIGSLKIFIANFFRSLTRSGDVKERKQKKHSGSLGKRTKEESLEMRKRKVWFIPSCFSASRKHQ